MKTKDQTSPAHHFRVQEFTRFPKKWTKLNYVDLITSHVSCESQASFWDGSPSCQGPQLRAGSLHKRLDNTMLHCYTLCFDWVPKRLDIKFALTTGENMEFNTRWLLLRSISRIQWCPVLFVFLSVEGGLYEARQCLASCFATISRGRLEFETSTLAEHPKTKSTNPKTIQDYASASVIHVAAATPGFHWGNIQEIQNLNTHGHRIVGLLPFFPDRGTFRGSWLEADCWVSQDLLQLCCAFFFVTTMKCWSARYNISTSFPCPRTYGIRTKICGLVRIACPPGYKLQPSHHSL